jgi:acetyl-CoA carboxylase carboxyltransferase component
VVIANDNTVASGSWWPRTPEKIIRAQELALRMRIPIVYLVDCSGLFLPEQGRSFPGRRGAGHIFAMNARLSAAGVPQVSGVFGDCIAGGGYMPLISDKVYMTESAYMVIAGAALIQGAKGQNLSSLDIGGADVHVHLSGCADFRVPDDRACVEAIRAEVASLPTSAAGYYRYGLEAAPPHHEPSELTRLLPARASEPYEVREVISRLVDDSLFWEVMPDRGHEVVTGVARIAGLYVGILANEQGLTQHPTLSDKKRPGGILYREGVTKLSLFSRACNEDGIPLIWLQDISGFDIGTEAEKQGLLGFGSSLIYTNSTNTTPMLTLLLRKASGAGYYAMAGLPYEPALQLSTVASRLAVMEGKTLAIGAFNTRLDDNFQIVASSPEERARIEAGMRAVEERIERDMDPYAAAKQMDTDEIIRLSEIRSYLEMFAEMAYQAAGTRRIRNPRIWSLHDIAVVTGEAGGVA